MSQFFNLLAFMIKLPENKIFLEASRVYLWRKLGMGLGWKKDGRRVPVVKQLFSFPR